MKKASTFCRMTAAPGEAHGFSKASAIVLIVDDDATLREIMARALTGEGYRVLLASNGADALAIAQTLAGKLALVVTDIRMPEMDGFELARHLGQLTPALPITFVSGYMPDPPQDAPLGPFLAKPFAPSDLVMLTRGLLAAST